MRWSTVNFVLLACVATTLASDESTRSKRDLLYLKNLITSTLFGTSHEEISPNPAKPVLIRDDGSVKIFRIPGFNNILVKAVPKVNNIEAIVPIENEDVNPKLSVIQSYLGTNTPDETFIALQGVKNLLESGVLYAKHDDLEVVPAKPPAYVCPPKVPEIIDVLEPKPVVCPSKVPEIIDVLELKPVVCPPKVPEIIEVLEPKPVVCPPKVPEIIKVLEPKPVVCPPKVPEIIDVLEPKPVVCHPPKLPVFPILPPIPRPVQICQPHLIQPIKVPQIMPVPLPSKYSYKQTKNYGSVTTYSTVNSQDVIVRETNEPMPPPPPYILDRLQQICFGVPWSATAIPVQVPKMPCAMVRKPTANVNVPITLHTNLDASNFHSFYYKPLLNDGKVMTSTVQTATKEPTLMPRLPSYSYMYDNTKKTATNPYSLPNTPSAGYSFSTVNNKGYVQTADRGHILYNHPKSHLLIPKPIASRYVYKKIDHNRPEYFAVTEDKPRFYTIGQDKVKVNSGNSNGNEERHSGSTFSSGKYSYKQIYNDGSSSTHSGSVGHSNDDGPEKFTIKTNNVLPLIPPAQIVNRIKNTAAYGQKNQLPKAPTGYSYKIDNSYVDRGKMNETLATNKGETQARPGIVMFEKPVPSSYIYKQINHNSPHPFTVVNVEDKPTLKTKGELGEVFVSVNEDEYGKSEASQDIVRTTPQIPKPFEYVFVPPLLADEEPLPNQFKPENGNANKDTSDGHKEQSTAQNFLKNNPIVVAPLEQIYSYKQSNSDGSSTYVKSSGKTITEKVNGTKERFRGDIPEAIS